MTIFGIIHNTRQYPLDTGFPVQKMKFPVLSNVTWALFYTQQKLD